MKEIDSIVERLEQFAGSFDAKDWDQMMECLSDQIWVNYSDFRSTSPESMSSSNYVGLRKIGLNNLETIHSFKNHEIQIDQNQGRCNCDFEIKRFDNSKNDHYHSYGKYQFDLVQVSGTWKIERITQTVERSEGNRNIHGAF